MNITAFDLAQRFVGTDEVQGAASNPQILAMLQLDGRWPKDDAVAWCSAFVNYIAWLLRLPRSKSLAARSWLQVGRPIELKDAMPGFDVVVLDRPPDKASGHVGFFAGFGDGINVHVLGGNQKDSVSIATFGPGHVIGVRRLLVALLLVAAAAVAPAAAQADAFDLSAAAIVNAPNVRTWAATATISELSFLEGTTRVVFSKQYGNGRWPDVTPAGWDGPLQYTLWLCLKVPDWTCSGFIQFWNGRDGTGDSSDPDVPSRWDQHWYYAARWTPLFGHGQIQPGEPIGLFVTSGNARDSAGPYGPQERSNVIVVPATDRGTFTFAPAPPVATPPPPVIVVPPPAQPPVVTPPPPLDLSGVYAQLAALKQDIAAARAASEVFYEEARSKWKDLSLFLAKWGSVIAGSVFAGLKIGGK